MRKKAQVNILLRIIGICGDIEMQSTTQTYIYNIHVPL